MKGIRRSLLFVTGNSPGMILNGCIFGADSVVFDLEDAVSPGEKDAARILVRNALKTLDYGNTERIVRINSLKTPYWMDDLNMIIPAGPDVIMPPKVQGEEDIHRIESFISGIEKDRGIPAGRIKLLPLIESALGVEKAFEIAGASKRITGLFLGAEDLTADIGAKRTKKGNEILYSRSRIVIAAKAAGVSAIDTPYTDVNDEEGLIQDAVLARGMGFNGKAVISPRHVEYVNRVFTPTEEEIEYARRVLEATARGEKEGKGAVSLDGKMIDAPIVARAKQILEIAETLKGGKLR